MNDQMQVSVDDQAPQLFDLTCNPFQQTDLLSNETSDQEAAHVPHDQGG